MIARVLGQGQWLLEVDDLEALNAIDEDLEKAVEQSDSAAMREALQRLFEAVRERGTPVPDEVIAESDIVLPDPDATLDEVRALLEATSEYFGLVPDEPVAESDQV